MAATICVFVYVGHGFQFTLAMETLGKIVVVNHFGGNSGIQQ